MKYDMKKKVTFEDMPELLADLSEQMKVLSQSVELIMKKEKIQLEMEAIVDNHGRRILTVEELCAYLKKSKSTVYRLVHSGDIPYFKQGRAVTFYEDEIKKWMESSRGRSIDDMLNQKELYMSTYFR